MTVTVSEGDNEDTELQRYSRPRMARLVRQYVQETRHIGDGFGPEDNSWVLVNSEEGVKIHSLRIAQLFSEMEL